MRIRCERCATTYELDEKKLPPHGGMVKCTRCQHVFRAAPPAAGTPPPEAVAPSRSVQLPSVPRAPVVPGNGVDAAAAEKTAVFGFSSPGDREGTANLGAAAPHAGGGARFPGSEGAGASETGAAPGSGGRRWVWLVLVVALAGAAAAAILR